MSNVLSATRLILCRNWKVGEAADGKSSSVMLPLMDMLNHDRDSPNRMRFNGGAFELVHEGEGIEAGDEVHGSLASCLSPHAIYVQTILAADDQESSLLARLLMVLSLYIADHLQL